MKKWNNVYFYSYDSSGNIYKHKIINIVEGTASDHNISIYPETGYGALASTAAVGSYDAVELGTIEHRHYSDWTMKVYLWHFYDNGTNTTNELNLVRERTGAHEFGHVLGLRDIENYCGADTADEHHYEILMGYGTLAFRCEDITYKDIAGVAITRGFHTDDDHMWLNCGLQDDGMYKLVCSVCNGVKMVESLSGYVYNTYGACDGDHRLPYGNMMAVASYGTKDYYKCKYCRYVAPFSSLAEQAYMILPYSAALHEGENNVSGLNYKFYEEHTFVDNECVECWYSHTHSYHYSWLSYTSHLQSCACGDSSNKPHVVKAGSTLGSSGYAICLLCKGQASIGAIYDSINDLPRTQNGSYILPNGTVVLVDEDIDAYMNGNLIFYSGETE